METRAKYKKGDLIILNDFGFLVIETKIHVGIIISDPYFKWWPRSAQEAVALQFWAYDVQFGSEVMDLVPEDFLDRMTKDKDEKTE